MDLHLVRLIEGKVKEIDTQLLPPVLLKGSW